MKKGELMTSQIVGFILLIISFIIVLWIYFQIAFPEQIDRTTCHESVVLRATLGAVTPLDIGTKFTPLQCKTEKICIGGDCKEFEGAKNVLNIKAKDIDDDRDVEKVIAQEMVDCWTMMGAGKVAVFTTDIPAQYHLSKLASTCVVCSRIAISDNIDKKIVDEVNPMDYMFNHKVPGEEVSYYEFFSGDSSGATIQEDIMKEQIGSEKNAPEVAVVFMQALAADDDVWSIVKKDVTTILIGGVGIGQMGGGFVLTSAAKVIGTKVLGVAAIVGGVAVGGMQTYYVFKNRDIIAGYCGDVSLGETKGCSVVRVIPYDVENLKNYCGNLESIS